ncbi:MAG: ATP-binding protein [Clostridiales bacterium]|jgi:anti-sigma regulatory factor (Ser/Thr protein kinase)|nr:ATP-binding protein [Clostridiales bacterium]
MTERITVSADKENAETLLDWIDEKMAAAGFGSRARREMRLASEEVFVNISEHSVKRGSRAVTVLCGFGVEELSLTFIDDGGAYNPLERPAPDITLPLEQREIGGLGVFLVKKFTDRAEYRRETGLNYLAIFKNKKAGDS